MKPSNNKYNITTITIHWLSTVLILILFPMGSYMSGLDTTEKLGLVQTHALLGISVFLLTIIRTYFFFTKKRPKDIQTGSPINNKLIIWIHNTFYILLFAITISGIATMLSGGYINALESKNTELINQRENIKPLEAHGITSFILMILLLVHIAGVIKHYIKTKENTLKRILP